MPDNENSKLIKSRINTGITILLYCIELNLIHSIIS